MNNRKLLAVVIASLIILLIMVMLRSSEQNLFRRNVEHAVKPQNGPRLTTKDLQNSGQPYTFVVLDDSSPGFSPAIHIPYQNILQEENQAKLRAIDGDIVLYSKNTPAASQVWVILNQLGFENLFVYVKDTDPEVLKYEFRPDTIARPEPESYSHN